MRWPYTATQDTQYFLTRYSIQMSFDDEFYRDEMNYHRRYYY